MNILVFGDVVGKNAVELLTKKLWAVRRQFSIDFCLANGENATNSKGVLPADAQALLDSGVDLLTMGNHTFGLSGFDTFLDAHPSEVIRPANFPPETAGVGYTIKEVKGYKLLCINVSGNAFMSPCENYLFTLDKILEREKGNYDFAICDLHAEATSEKMACAFDFDGKIHILYGTHTHVPTCDARIMKNGMGYITDIGMTGPIDSVIGTDAQTCIDHLRGDRKKRFFVPEGQNKANAVVFTLDENTKRVTSIKRITF